MIAATRVDPRRAGHRRECPGDDAGQAAANQEHPDSLPFPSGFSVWLTMRILEVVGGARHGLTAAEIAKACGLSPQGAQRMLALLRDLCNHRYLWRWDTGGYTLGPAFVERFADFATQQRDLRKTGAGLTDLGPRPKCLLKYLLSRGVCTCGVRHRPRRSR